MSRVQLCSFTRKLNQWFHLWEYSCIFYMYSLIILGISARLHFADVESLYICLFWDQQHWWTWWNFVYRTWWNCVYRRFCKRGLYTMKIFELGSRWTKIIFLLVIIFLIIVIRDQRCAIHNCSDLHVWLYATWSQLSQVLPSCLSWKIWLQSMCSSVKYTLYIGAAAPWLEKCKSSQSNG